MGRRSRPVAGLPDGMVLALLADADQEFAARALRRHEAWRQAVEHGSSSQCKRSLRRAWERARDEALIAVTLEVRTTK